jgi:2-keto-4-pentenoate hydratase/2-oxohepta-3-ene-1,7-dioic acid hydratase in catechol pathway
MTSTTFHPNWPTLSGLQTSDGNELSAASIYCIGRNFAEHAAEMNSPIPKEPLIFTKPIGSLLVGAEATVEVPAQSNEVHHEIEWVVALSKGGKNIPEHIAWEYVAGWSVGIDFTARDLQATAKKAGKPWAVSKGFDGFGPVSPFTPKPASFSPLHLGDYQLELTVNGRIRQQDTLSNMLFTLPELIHYLSTLFTLRTGDILFTGTPSGVSQVQAGDQCRAILRNEAGELASRLDVEIKAAQ